MLLINGLPVVVSAVVFSWALVQLFPASTNVMASVAGKVFIAKGLNKVVKFITIFCVIEAGRSLDSAAGSLLIMIG